MAAQGLEAEADHAAVHVPDPIGCYNLGKHIAITRVSSLGILHGLLIKYKQAHTNGDDR
jgi:hypothetical protein